MKSQKKKKVFNFSTDLKDCQELVYGHGANMINKERNTRQNFAQKSRSILWSCIVHSLDLLKDMASNVLVTMTFWGVIQRLYTIFPGYAKRWNILMKHIKQI